MSRKMGASGRVRVSLKIRYRVRSGSITASSAKVIYFLFMMVTKLFGPRLSLTQMQYESTAPKKYIIKEGMRVR